MDTAEFYLDPLNEAIDSMVDGAREATDTFARLVETVFTWAPMIPAPVLWWLEGKLKEISELINQIIDRVDQALDRFTPVISLIRTAYDWVNSVKTPVSALSFTATEPCSEDLAKWTGAARSAYDRKALQQRNAIDDVARKAEFISRWLQTIAQSNVDYAVGLAEIVTDLVGDLITAVAEAETGIGIPWAVDQLADQAGDLVAVGLSTLLEIGNRLVEALGNVRDLAGQAGDYTHLPGQHWPEAVRSA